MTGTRRGILSAVGVAVGVLAVLLLSRRPSGDAPSAALGDWYRIASGRLHLEIRSANPSAVSGFFVERALPFAVEPGTVPLPGYRLIGAHVRAIGGRPSALAVHRDARNKIVVCQRFVGRVEELPRPDRTFARGAVKVHLHRFRRGNVVFWQDGAVIRSLASDVPGEELVRIAFSRTVPSAP